MGSQSMMDKNHFPQGIAFGESFLGRASELKTLKYNINSSHHTLLLAPRRYGKSSLALNALKKLKLPSVEVNFFLAVTERAAERKIIDGVQELIHSVTQRTENILSSIQTFFKNSNKKWTFSIGGVGVELNPDRKDEPATNVHTALMLLEHVLLKKKKKAVIFFDEIQELEALQEGRAIAGAIRDIAQKSEHLIFIFSGSNRRMLHYMFDNSTMPLFELCDRIILDKLDKSLYEKYLQKIAKKTWNTLLSQEVIDKIIQLSQCHPRRIYNLCYLIWKDYSKDKNVPTLAKIEQCWFTLLEQRLKDVRYTLHRTLNPGQIKVLSLVASGAVRAMSGKVAQRMTNLTSPTIVKHLQALEELDYIERYDKSLYGVIDPVIADILKEHEQANLEQAVEG